jgi:hypothetical protein
MLPQKSKSKGSCAVAAFATVTGQWIDDLVKELGHDGSEPLIVSGKEIVPHIGVNVQEIIPPLLRKGWAIVEICGIDLQLPEGVIHPCVENTPNAVNLRIQAHMADYSGVLVVKQQCYCNHALAWDHQEGLCFDPTSAEYIDLQRHIYDGKPLIESIDLFWMTVPMRKKPWE